MVVFLPQALLCKVTQAVSGSIFKTLLGMPAVPKFSELSGMPLAWLL